MVLENRKSYGYLSFILSGPNMKDLTLVKKHLLLLIKIARHLWMEKEILELNARMLQTVKYALPGNSLVTYGDFSRYIDEL
jgi:hypothetical protein